MKVGDLVKGTWEDSPIGILIDIELSYAKNRHVGKVYWSNGTCYRYLLDVHGGSSAMKVGDLIRVKDRLGYNTYMQNLTGHIGIVVSKDGFLHHRTTVFIQGENKALDYRGFGGDQ